MEIDKWFGCCNVRAFPWIDGKRIYVNVRYFAPGQSIEQPPVWGRSVYVTDNENGRRLVYQFTNTLVQGITGMQISPGQEITLTA